jgi:hypothetical protein
VIIRTEIIVDEIMNGFFFISTSTSTMLLSPNLYSLFLLNDSEHTPPEPMHILSTFHKRSADESEKYLKDKNTNKKKPFSQPISQTLFSFDLRILPNSMLPSYFTIFADLNIQ